MQAAVWAGDGREVGLRPCAHRSQENTSYGAASRRVDALGGRGAIPAASSCSCRRGGSSRSTRPCSTLSALRPAVVTGRRPSGAPGGAEALADAIRRAPSSSRRRRSCARCSSTDRRYTARCAAWLWSATSSDLLMPSRKSNGAKVTRWQDRGDHPAEALAKLAAARRGSSLQGARRLGDARPREQDQARTGAERRAEGGAASTGRRLRRREELGSEDEARARAPRQRPHDHRSKTSSAPLLNKSGRRRRRGRRLISSKAARRARFCVAAQN